MPNITVNTTSTNFSLLPADLSQYSNWLNQYAPTGVTIFQNQSNAASGMLALANQVNAYLSTYGYSSASFINTNELQVTAGSYILDYYGTFGSSNSIVTEISIYNSANKTFGSEHGNFIFSGYPLSAALETGSTMTAATDYASNPVTPPSAVSEVVLLNVTWNGTSWNGTTAGYSEAISDTANSEMIQINILESPDAISFAANTPSTTGFLFFSAPTVIGVGIDVSNYTTGVLSDSVLIAGVSYSASSVSASQVIPAAVAGNDVVSITGSGSLNIISALVNAGNSVTSVKLSDSAANVVVNLDLLETLAAQGKLTSITLTDTGTPVLTITATQKSADALALKAIVSPYSVAVTGGPPTAPTGPLLDNLNLNQQLELIYIAYYNRAADEGGFGFWGGQNATAQANGQSAALALTNIANAFAPQAEIDALYPILGTPNLNLQTAAAQAGLATFIGNVYSNLFDRTADTAGETYWVGQITNGAVGLGAAALAIANGATGGDAIEVQNKIAVALDFTTRTAASGLGVTPPYASSFLPAARSVLAGVDGTTLNDASVTAGEAATTTFISSAPTAIVATAGALSASSANDQITISTSNSVTDPGAGSFTIQFAAGVSDGTVVLHSGGTDQIIGFNPAAGDVLDLSSLLVGAQLTAQDVVPNLGSYFSIADQGADAVLLFDPLGHGNGSAVAVLKNLAGDVTSLGVLSGHNALQL